MYKKLFAAPLALSLALSAIAPTMAHAEETVATTEVAQATAVTPTILFKGVPTANYNAMFANTAVVKDGDVYKVTMDVSSLFTLFQVNGKDVVLEKGATDKDPQKATFTIDSLESNPTIKIAYTAGPMGVMSHDFTFDFTPTAAELQVIFDKEAAISYTAADAVKTKEDLEEAAKQLKNIDGIIASVKASLSATEAAAFVAPEGYEAQQAAIAAYKAQFTTAATDAFSKLTFTAAESITTEAQLAEAKSQLEAAQTAITNATAAGLVERADLSGLAGYANVAAQKAVIEAGVKEDTSTVTPPASATTTVAIDLWYKGAINNNYTNLFGKTTVTPVGNQYEVTIEVPQMLTTFEVAGVTLEKVSETEQHRTMKFTVDSVSERLPIKIGYTVGNYEGKHDMELALNYTPGGSTTVTPPTTTEPETAEVIKVVPTILYNEVPTAAYNTMFANTEIVKDGKVYKVTMDVSSLFTLFQVNGNDIVLEKGATDKDPQKATFTIESLEKNPTIKIAYSAGPMGVMSHDFKVDFTPTAAEYKVVFDKAVAISYTAADSVKTKEDVTAAAAQLKNIDNIIASAKASLSAADAAAFVAPEGYEAQKAAIAAYKVQFTTAAADAFGKLTFTAAESITTKAQLAEAKAQLEAAQAAIAKAVAAGLTERADLASLAGYANVAAQKTVVEAAEKALAEEVQTVRTLSGKVSNAKGASDIVKVYGLQKGDTVRLYNAKGKVLKTATATGEYSRISGVSLGKAVGKVYVTAQAKDEKQSAKKAVAFKAEPVAKAVAKTQISVKNNKGKADAVTVKGTAKGQKIRVYNEAGKSLKTVTATSKTTKISIKQLGKKAGKISVARIQDGKHISAKTTVKFSKEQ